MRLTAQLQELKLILDATDAEVKKLREKAVAVWATTGFHFPAIVDTMICMSKCGFSPSEIDDEVEGILNSSRLFNADPEDVIREKMCIANENDQ